MAQTIVSRFTINSGGTATLTRTYAGMLARIVVYPIDSPSGTPTITFSYDDGDADTTRTQSFLTLTSVSNSANTVIRPMFVSHNSTGVAQSTLVTDFVNKVRIAFSSGTEGDVFDVAIQIG